MYPLVRPILFRQDPEAVHGRVMAALAWAGRHPVALSCISALCRVADPRLRVERFGLRFPNPIGLAAGLDKNGVAVPVWPALGFGHAEIGSVTALAQGGHSKPRLFRLPEDKALINRMGFNNDGAEAIAARLERLGRRPAAPLGLNLGKSGPTPLDQAAADYGRSMELLWPHADYFVVNVSSPNTPGLRTLQAADRLTDLLAAVQELREDKGNKPVLLKIAPELSWPQLDEVVALAQRYGISGLIATNTTVARDGLSRPVAQPGGLSGLPLRKRSLEVLRHLRSAVGGSLPIVSVGGIFTADDVFERLASGASLVQLYTGYIYEGPLLIRRLNLGLLARLDREGIPDVESLVGSCA